MELKEELCNTGLSFARKKQQECNLTEITKTVEGRCSDTEKQNTSEKLSQRRPIIQLREINFFWGKSSYIEWCSKKWNSVAAIRSVARTRRKGKRKMLFASR